MSADKKLVGTLHMARLLGGGSKEMYIEVVDKASGAQFLTLHVPLEAFATALTGGHGDCTFDLRATEIIGMRHENKTEFVPFPDPHSDKLRRECKGRDDAERSPTLNAALKPFEIDGWIGSTSDLLNHHRRKEGGYRVSFHRYVNPETGKPVLL